MPFRFVVRPRHIRSTPALLKTALGAQRMLPWPSRQGRRPSWLKDFLLTYPKPEDLEDFYAYSETDRLLYRLCSSFARASKPTQRRLLADSFPVPETYRTHGEVDAHGRLDQPGRFVVRPLRHSEGRNYRVTSDPNDFIEGQEYISHIYPKTHEYRIIAVRGNPLITLLKKHPGLDPEQPWNHANGSYFVTVHHDQNNRLRRTDIYDRVRSCELLKGLHLAGIDVLFRRPSDYVVCEVNTCPSLTIEENLRKVSDYALEASHTS